MIRAIAKQLPGVTHLYQRYHHIRYFWPQYRKERQLRGLALLHRRKVFVETGTFNGDMLYMMRPLFRELHSIEIDEDWCQKARLRFENCYGVFIHKGDSAEKLEGVLKCLHRPAFIYLDAHVFGFQKIADTPLWRELQAVAKHAKPESVIVIDDFPQEEETIRAYFRSIYPAPFYVYRAHDFIVITL